MASEVRASHILCKHAQSRNPVSRRTGEPTTEYSKEAARKAISEILAQLKDIQQMAVMKNLSKSYQNIEI